nr:MAG: Topo mini-A [uncultured archaeon]
MVKTNIKLPKTQKGRKSESQKIQYISELQDFANNLILLQLEIAEITNLTEIKDKDKVSSRGWCYLLEGFNLITKDKFDYCFNIINLCRKEGYLPIDFVFQDESRNFFNVEKLKEEYERPIIFINKYLRAVVKTLEKKKDIAFWESQKYYLQMMVEKIDVRNLFEPICKEYHIPISNAKGWSDMLSRNDLIQRFKESEEIGLKPILLYYGDFDPAGIKIAETLKKNIRDLEKATEYNPTNLTIDHFGLTIDFIDNNNLLWINNLKTGGKRDLGKLYEQYKTGKEKVKIYDYEIAYIEKYGVRKCEANAILPIRKIAINQCEETIQKYLGDNPFDTYDKKIKENQKEVSDLMEKVNFEERIRKLMYDVKNTNQNQDFN